MWLWVLLVSVAAGCDLVQPDCDLHPECYWTGTTCAQPAENCSNRTSVKECLRGVSCDWQGAACQDQWALDPLFEQCRSHHPDTSEPPTPENTLKACLSDPYCQWSETWCSPVPWQLCVNASHCHSGCYLWEEQCEGFTAGGLACTALFSTEKECLGECEWQDQRCVPSRDPIYPSLREFCRSHDKDHCPTALCEFNEVCDSQEARCWYFRHFPELCSAAGCGWDEYAQTCKTVEAHTAAREGVTARLIWFGVIVSVAAGLLLAYGLLFTRYHLKAQRLKQ